MKNVDNQMSIFDVVAKEECRHWNVHTFLSVIKTTYYQFFSEKELISWIRAMYPMNSYEKNRHMYQVLNTLENRVQEHLIQERIYLTEANLKY